MLALLPAVFAGPALAQNSYDVDLVVFEHVDTQAAESERWRPRVVVPIISDATAFDSDGPRGERLHELPEGFERLDAENGELADAVERLEESSAYRVLHRMSWRQPALNAEDAIALRFDTGEPTTVQIPASAYPPPPAERAQSSDASQEADASRVGDASERTVEAAGTDSGLSTSRTGAAERAGGQSYTLDTPFGAGMLSAPQRDAEILPLDGTIKLVVSRYLHLHTDLYYTTEVQWQDEDTSGSDTPRASGETEAAAAGLSGMSNISRGPDGQPMLSYGMHQERRMRSGELHYLDHPVLGLLVKVTPHEPET